MISSEGTGDKTTQKEFDKWEDAMSDFDGKAGSTPSSSPLDGTRTTDPPSQVCFTRYILRDRSHLTCRVVVV